ncbi:hypothetical protein PAXINDRAFT_97546 [Paxillus involutus ATCC 200175]|nr:hypothetical protein PAXINDRAFT_97546 [Paxillus involutus ATCC 200175]
MVLTRSTLRNPRDKGATEATPPATESTATPAALSQDENSDYEIEPTVPEEDSFYNPGKKRAKRPQGKRNHDAESSKKPRRRGKLEMLPELNLDVLFQIFTFLHPMDLLNLTRTTKAFRQLLMQKSSAFAWKTARGQLEGFPDCPPDLSEPEYANLVFYPHCHNCGNVVPTIHWRLRRRYCPSCRKSRHVLFSVLARCHAHFCFSLQRRQVCGDPVRGGGFLAEEILKIDGRDKYGYVDIKHLDAFFEEYNKVPEDKRTEFLADRRLQVHAIDKHASECEAWHQDETEARKSQLQNARSTRAESIFARLQDLGYEAEINHFGKHHIEGFQRSLFNSTKRLTDKDWDRVRPQLEQKMIDCRKRRLEEAVYKPRRKLLVEFYDAYVRQPAPEGAAIELLPSIADLDHLPDFDTIIKLPEGTDVNAETFKSAFERLPALVQEWRAGVDAQLAALVVIPPELSTNSLSADQVADQKSKSAERLRLASAVFNVPSSGVLWMFPDLLALSMFHTRYYSSGQVCHHPWSLTTEHGNAVIELFKEAAYVVRACGLDPQTVTVEDMDTRNARLICNLCSSPNPRVRTWTDALWHAKSHRTYGTDQASNREGQWSLVDDCHMPKIQAAEQPPIRSPYHSPKAHCAFCQKRVGDILTPGEIRGHLKSKHSIDVDMAIRGDHYIPFEPCLSQTVENIAMKTTGEVVRFLHPSEFV